MLQVEYYAIVTTVLSVCLCILFYFLCIYCILCKYTSVLMLYVGCNLLNMCHFQCSGVCFFCTLDYNDSVAVVN